MDTYHFQIWQTRDLALFGEVRPFPGPDFQHVADVQVLAPNFKLACAGAFRVTQHGVQETAPDWTQSQYVTFCHDQAARSTSVGDVLVSQGKAYRVLNAGFAPVS